MMQYLFYLLCLVGTSYYLFRKRTFDFFTIAFASAILYFSPGFSGLVLNPYDTDQTMPLHAWCYSVFCMVLLCNLLFVMLFDHYTHPCVWWPMHKATANYYTEVATIIAIIGLGMSLLKHSTLYFHRDEISKGDLQAILNTEADRWSVCWAMGALLLCIISFIKKQKHYTWLAFIILALDLWLGGNRSTTIFALIAMLCVRLSNAPKRLGAYFFSRKYLGKILFMSIIGLVFFISKLLLPLLQANRMDLFEEIYPSWNDILFHTFVTGEPAGIQANLSETLRKEISTDFYHPIDLAAQLSIGGDWLGMDSKSHYLDQKDLFPDLAYGIAYNIWGDVWASGGWFLLIVFILIYHVVIALGSFLLRCTQGFSLGVTALFFSIWAFYIHRNNLLFQLYLQKRVLIFALFIWLVAQGIKRLRSTIAFK